MRLVYCLRAVSLLTLLICIIGCVRPLIGWASYVNRSVKANESLHGGYVLDGMYQVTLECSVLKKQIDSSFCVLVPTGNVRGSGYWDGPKSRAEYDADPTKYPDVLGFIPAGTRLKCVDIRERGFRVVGTVIDVVAVISEGDFKGVKVVLDDLSKDIPSPEDDAWRAARRAARTDSTVKVGKPPVVPLEPDMRLVVPCK